MQQQVSVRAARQISIHLKHRVVFKLYYKMSLCGAPILSLELEVRPTRWMDTGITHHIDDLN